MPDTITTTISPLGSMDILSQEEAENIRSAGENGSHELFRRCALAVLNTGTNIDNAKQVLEVYRDFDIHPVQSDRGVRLELRNAPASAFVDGRIIQGIREHLFSVLRDIIYTRNQIERSNRFNLLEPRGITNAVFHILRNAQAFAPIGRSRKVVCWGGHSIGRVEYDYTKEVGYELGLRGADICTGCGPGAMKGPMKGAAVGQAKQRNYDGAFVGVSEPGIIAAEPPNPIVNKLVILPDIEKRLEAFVRLGHAFVVFPGGVGTAEEILYLLGILLHPDNRNIPAPLILTGPREAEAYFRQIDRFIRVTLGEEARERYEIIVDDPERAARAALAGVDKVIRFREREDDACYFTWQLHIDPAFQAPFHPTHETMAGLDLSLGRPPHRLAVDLRRVFSGIVAGNVKEEGIRAVEQRGPFEIHASAEIMGPLDDLLAGFVEQQRMKLPTSEYVPCYRLVS